MIRHDLIRAAAMQVRYHERWGETPRQTYRRMHHGYRLEARATDAVSQAVKHSAEQIFLEACNAMGLPSGAFS